MVLIERKKKVVDRTIDRRIVETLVEKVGSEADPTRFHGAAPDHVVEFANERLHGAIYLLGSAQTNFDC